MPLMTVNKEILEVAYQIAGDRIEGALYKRSKVAGKKSTL
jgi:polyribonucleotide nucleotidyltransferase